MLKRKKQYDLLIELVQDKKPNSIREAFMYLGKQMEGDKDYEKAEQFYLRGNLWQYVIEMYEKLRKYEECIRICKAYASERDTVERAKKWE